MSAYTCPKCGAVNRGKSLSCIECGALLFDPKETTISVKSSQALLRLRHTSASGQQMTEDSINEVLGTIEQNIRKTLLIQIRGMTARVNFEDNTEIIVGRIDLSKPNPHVLDLGKFGGHERGVSREHAILRYKDGQFTLTDLKSVNGTSVNGLRLEPGSTVPLHDGDGLLLGSLGMSLRIEGTGMLGNASSSNMIAQPIVSAAISAALEHGGNTENAPADVNVEKTADKDEEKPATQPPTSASDESKSQA